MQLKPLISVADVEASGRFHQELLGLRSGHAFDSAVARARKLGAEIVRDVHVNPNARQRELWLRDVDGYLIALAEDGG